MGLVNDDELVSSHYRAVLHRSQLLGQDPDGRKDQAGRRLFCHGPGLVSYCFADDHVDVVLRNVLCRERDRSRDPRLSAQHVFPHIWALGWGVGLVAQQAEERNREDSALAGARLGPNYQNTILEPRFVANVWTVADDPLGHIVHGNHVRQIWDFKAPRDEQGRLGHRRLLARKRGRYIFP